MHKGSEWIGQQDQEIKPRFCRIGGSRKLADSSVARPTRWLALLAITLVALPGESYAASRIGHLARTAIPFAPRSTQSTRGSRPTANDVVNTSLAPGQQAALEGWVAYDYHCNETDQGSWSLNSSPTY